MSREETSQVGIDFKTLAVASAASATATLVVPLIWQPGTLPAAATMPIIVALVSEALKRPTVHVAKVRGAVHAVPISIHSERRTEAPSRQPRVKEFSRQPRVKEFSRQLHVNLVDDERRRRRLLRIAVVTGLVAFALVATVWTVAELAAGGSVTGDSRTSYFGGETTQGAGEPQETDAAPAPPAEEPAPPATDDGPAPPAADGEAVPPPATEPSPAPGSEAPVSPAPPAPEGSPPPTARPPAAE